MKRINAIEEYSDLRKKMKSKGKIQFNNNFYLSNQIEAIINNQSLYFVEDEYSLYLFIDRTTYYDLALMSTKIEKTIIPNTSKPCLLSYTFNTNKPVLIDNIVTNMIRNEFVILSNNAEMTLKANVVSRSKNETMKDITVEDLFEENIIDLVNVWTSTLNKYVNPIPSQNEILNEMEKYRVITYNGTVVGGMTIADNGNRKLISQIAISPEFQGRGLGFYLVNHAIQMYPEKDLNLWVSKENLIGINLYSKIGFEFTNKESIQFIKEN